MELKVNRNGREVGAIQDAFPYLDNVTVRDGAFSGS